MARRALEATPCFRTSFFFTFLDQCVHLKNEPFRVSLPTDCIPRHYTIRHAVWDCLLPILERWGSSFSWVGVGVGFWCAVCLLAHPPCYIIRFQWYQFVLNKLMILGVRNAIRKCHKMNEGCVIVVLAHHDALILPYEFLVVFSSAVWVFSRILTAIQLKIQSAVR